MPYWKASKDLPGPGMTCTVGPIGVCAQPASSKPSIVTPDMPAVLQPRCFTARFPLVLVFGVQS
jgi:hypothetical protein